MRTRTWEPTLIPCRNRDCRALFVPRKPRQTCCSPECGRAVRNKVMRAIVRRKP